MYFEITAPAICIEYENGACVTQKGEVRKEVDVEMPNPNLDYYLTSDTEWLGDHRIVTIQGREWELELSKAEITLELSVKELRDSAKIRAAEDHCLEPEVLDQWQSWNVHDSLKRTFSCAIHEIVTGEPTLE